MQEGRLRTDRTPLKDTYRVAEMVQDALPSALCDELHAKIFGARLGLG